MLNEKKAVPKLRQEVKVTVDIVTSDDIKTYYTGKFQDSSARYIIKPINSRIYLTKSAPKIFKEKNDYLVEIFVESIH